MIEQALLTKISMDKRKQLILKKTLSHLQSLRLTPTPYFTYKTLLVTIAATHFHIPTLPQNRRLKKKKPHDWREKKLRGKSERKRNSL
jgi:hypothetical protein